MTLKAVVFPAPFGPMRPTISRSPTAMARSATAVRPPKRIVTPRVSSKAMLLPRRRRDRRAPPEHAPGELAAAHEPALAEQHDHHQHQREHHHAQAGPRLGDEEAEV